MMSYLKLRISEVYEDKEVIKDVSTKLSTRIIYKEKILVYYLFNEISFFLSSLL